MHLQSFPAFLSLLFVTLYCYGFLSALLCFLPLSVCLVAMAVSLIHTSLAELLFQSASLSS